MRVLAPVRQRTVLPPPHCHLLRFALPARQLWRR
jgi:hypothetical protein